MPKVTLRDMKIVGLNIDMPRGGLRLGEVKVECKSKAVRSKMPDDISAMVIMEVRIFSPNQESFSIEIDADAIFDFDSMPEDYNEICKTDCVPMGMLRIYDKLDDILTTMGLGKLGLSRRIMAGK